MCPPVVDQVDFGGQSHHESLEVVHAGPLPSRFELLGEVRIGGPVASFTDRRGRALEHVEVVGRCRQVRDALQAARPGADEGHDLVRKGVEWLVGPAARVLVVPARRVERRPREVLHAVDVGQLQQVQDPHGEHVPAAVDLVAAVRVDAPPRQLVMPFGAQNPRVEEGVVVEVEPVGDRLEVTQDLLTGRVAPCGDVVELLEHRQVDVGLDVAHHAGVAIPVPGSSHATGLIDDADALHTGLAELDAGEDSCDPAADDHDVDVVDDRVALGHRRERVVAVVGEMLVGAQVPDVGAPGNQPLVPFGEVLGADLLGVEGCAWWVGPMHTPI